MARDAGARKVYFASASPPVRYPNVYGIDMPATAELIAHGRDVAEIEKELGADWLIYQDLDDLVAACREGNEKIGQFDTSCFSGAYVTGVADGYLERLEANRADQVREVRRTSVGMKLV
jgi:amidophosphoribosyltransferase